MPFLRELAQNETQTALSPRFEISLPIPFAMTITFTLSESVKYSNYNNKQDENICLSTLEYNYYFLMQEIQTKK